MKESDARCANPVGLRVEILQSREEFDRLKPHWNALFERAYNAAPPLHYDWVSTWLDIYGRRYLSTNNALRFVCCWRGEDLVGALPLYMRRPLRVADGGLNLMFTSTGEQMHEEVCPDYMDLLCTEQSRHECAQAAWNAIFHDMRGQYDRLELTNMSAESALVACARKRADEPHVEILPQGTCCISNLEDGMEAYLSRLSHKMRAQARRLLRAAQRENVTLEVAGGGEELRQYFNEMIELHQRRWRQAGEPGVFASPAFTRFHRVLAEKWVPEGRAMVARVRHDGATIAVKYGFLVKGKFDYYQSGVQLDGLASLESPGTLGLLLLMRYLSERGAEVFDFLRGSAVYKQRLATDDRPLVELRRVLWSWRTTVGLAASLGSRCARKAMRLLSGGRPMQMAPAMEA